MRNGPIARGFLPIRRDLIGGYLWAKVSAVKYFRLLALLLLLPVPAFAAGGDSLGVRYSVGAAADLQGQYFPNALSPQVGQTFGILNAEVVGTAKVGRTFLLKVRPTGHLDPNNPTKGEQSWYDLPEGYAQLKGAIIEGVAGTLQLGYNTFSWGVTDGYNPVDVVSARRYSDPLNAEKLGAFSALGRLDLGWILAEGIYIPWQRSSTLPGDHSRWLPREISSQVKEAGVLFDTPKVPEYTFGPDRNYDNPLHNNFGGRLSSHFLGIDAALYHFEGASTVPGTAFHMDGDVIRVLPLPVEIAARSQILLTEIFHRVKVSGASAVFNVWEFVVRGETVVADDDHPGSSAFPEHETDSVVELEHTFSGEKSSLTVIGLQSFSNQRYGDSSTTSTPSLTQLFNRASGLGVRWQPLESLNGETFAVFDTLHGGQIYKAQLTYKLSDAWRVYGGGEIFSAKTAVPIGTYGKNSRMIAGLKLSI